MSITAAIVSL